MICKLKVFFSFVIIFLSFISMYTKAATCPPVESIKRVNGEYRWTTTEPGWDGYFLSPTIGKGRSYKIQNFVVATWVKAHDTANPAGFIQCDYYGEFANIIKPEKTTASDQNNIQMQEVVQNEIIRFVQKNAGSAVYPATNNNKNWLCSSIVAYPDNSCECFNSLEKCNFRLS